MAVATQTVSATPSDDKTGLKDAGVFDEYKQFLRESKYDEVDQLLEDNGVHYSNKSTINPLKGESDTESGNESQGNDTSSVSPDKIYLNPEKNDTSEQNLYVTYIGDNKHTFDLQLELEYTANVDTAGPTDGMAVSYSEVPYRTIPDSEVTSSNVELTDTHPHGVNGEFRDLQGTPNTTPRISINVEERNPSESTATTVYSDYIHTWWPGGFGGDVGISFPLTAAGNLTMEVSGSTNSYHSQQNTTYYP